MFNSRLDNEYLIAYYANLFKINFKFISMYCILPAMIENDFNLDGNQNILTFASQFENLSDLGVDLLNA